MTIAQRVRCCGVSEVLIGQNLSETVVKSRCGKSIDVCELAPHVIDYVSRKANHACTHDELPVDHVSHPAGYRQQGQRTYWPGSARVDSALFLLLIRCGFDDVLACMDLSVDLSYSPQLF